MHTAIPFMRTGEELWNALDFSPARTGNTQSRVVIGHTCAARRQVLRDTLDAGRFEVVDASTTTEVLTAVSAGNIDLVMIDIDLPELGAVDFCRVLKKASGTQFLPVFVLSPRDDAAEEVRAIESGADAFLLEPLRPAPLQARIQAMLRHKNMIESLDDSETVLFSLAQSVEERDPSLGQHCERLAQICSAMGLAIGVSAPDLLTLQRAGYLHDIGKVAIPDNILFKTGPLNEDEWTVMRSHCERGERICKNMRSLAPVLPVIRHHHERWDGTGYPDGLVGEEIPLLARILQIADIYDALTTSRPYKKAYTPEEAIEIMQSECARGWRDPLLTERFAEVLPMFRSASMPDVSQLSLRALARSIARAGHHERERRGGDVMTEIGSADVKMPVL